MQKQRDEDGGETLSELDKLYVVHVVQNKGKERWDSGGPILPRLSTALEKYPHTITEVEVSNANPPSLESLFVFVPEELILSLHAWLISTFTLPFAGFST